ncbi:MAG: Ppx/GppA family phosphatase [Epsilonproteobacteria bacterium]|nr:Ppx/GppA family phosphatase [Campylobacterota bacterium]MBD3839504.1 Ppx/GppA family phosphatase [Campylobacterota bacterium]
MKSINPHFKRIGVIDIGSNSARMVIFEQTSEYGFHLICEKKSRVRIGEGAYEHGGVLQEIGINRAFNALKAFKKTLDEFAVDKSICVATSALRDAPNGVQFIRLIESSIGLKIDIISGKQEAYFGAIASINLLPISNAVTIDIGGGSSELALIENSKVVKTYSLNLGTVRLKELFSDKNSSPQKTKEFILKELSSVPDGFKSALAVAIGGSVRALSKAIMRYSNYPLDKLHAFEYELKDYDWFMQKVIAGESLKELFISTDRFDTIKEGILIFDMILKFIGASRVITSGVGLREGIYLDEFLPKENPLFPSIINPSITSILDRFAPNRNEENFKLQSGKKLYALLSSYYLLSSDYEQELLYAIQLSTIKENFNIYKSYQHTFYIALNELNYKLTHNQIALVSLILCFGGKSLYKKEIFNEYKSILPQKEHIKLLSFVFTLNNLLYMDDFNAQISFKLKKDKLIIASSSSLYLFKENLMEIEMLDRLRIEVEF